MRQCLIITSCPPCLTITVAATFGLLLLLEEVILVPRFHKEPVPVRRDMPQVSSSNSEVIYEERISSIWRVDDFIVRKGHFQQPRGENQPSLMPPKSSNTSLHSKNYVKKLDNDTKLKPSEEERKIVPNRRRDLQNKTLDLSTAGVGNSIRVQRASNLSHNETQATAAEVKTDSHNEVTLKNDITHQPGKIKEPSSSDGSLVKNRDLEVKAETPKDEGRHGKQGENLEDYNGHFVNIGKRMSVLHNKIVKEFKLKGHEERHNFINLHRYGYVLDSHACDTGDPKFVVLVHSKFNNFIKRAKIRNTFAKNKTVLGVQFAVTFVLGKPNAESLQLDDTTPEGTKLTKKELTEQREKRWNDTMHRLEDENKIFQDIVMGNFTDSYRNLTIKHIMAYHWLLQRCKSPEFVVKVDDDILLNTFMIARLVKRANSDTKGLLICDVPESHKVMRGNKNKWFVSQQEYPFRFYPPWCKGYGVFMTRDVVRKLYNASSDIRDFWIDDVYVTGILAWRAGIKVRNFRKKHAPVNHNQFEASHIHAMFVWATFTPKNSHRAYWKDLVAAQRKL